MGNLGLTGAYADALKSLGFDLESVAGQVSLLFAITETLSFFICAEMLKSLSTTCNM